jgi:hypothetical protein
MYVAHQSPESDFSELEYRDALIYDEGRLSYQHVLPNFDVLKSGLWTSLPLRTGARSKLGGETSCLFRFTAVAAMFEVLPKNEH